MLDEAKRSPLLICTSCGQPATPGQHLCDHCGAPLTPFAYSDPVLGIHARGFAAHAATKTQKKIVVIGIWLWLLPMFIMGVGLMGLGGGGVIAAVKGDVWGWFGLPFAVLGGVFVWISATLMKRTTGSLISHWKASRSSDHSSVSNDEEGDEVLTCLGCGEGLQAGDEKCPQCGWSYAEQEE